MSLSSRRQFLRWSLGAAALPLPSIASTSSQPRVLIIGAGVAGLKAANTLQTSGCQVTMLEAAPQIGGRIRTDRSLFGNLPIEIGAQFIHGQSNTTGQLNPLWNLAQNQAWTTTPFSADSSTLLRQGLPLADADEDDLYALADAAYEWMIDVRKEQLEDNQTTVSVWSAFDAFAKRQRLSKTRRRDLRALLAADVEGDLAGDLNRISLLAYDEDEEFGIGGDRMLLGGYDQVTSHLAQGLDIRLNTRVRRIEHGNSPTRVITHSGTVFEADAVLVTTSLGVLRSGSITFSPSLPTPKRAALSRMRMGAFTKVILQFPERFWPTTNWTTNIIPKSPWGLSFASMETPHPGSNILIAWQSGTRARTLEGLSDTRVLPIIMRDLRATFPAQTLPNPSRFHVTRWSRDPLTLGAYSYPVIGAPRSDIHRLAAPVGARLFFAGEATSADYPGTAHGAWLSGQRAANEITTALAL